MARTKPASLLDQILSGGGKPAATPAPPLAPPVPRAAEPTVEIEFATPAQPEALPPPKKSDPLPRPGDAYRASAQFLNRLGTGERLIHFVDKECFSVGFCYSDLRRVSWQPGDTPGFGPVLVLLFATPTLTEVRINGRNLEDVRFYINEGLMPWIWEQPSGFKARADAAAVITAIVITEREG